MTNSNVSDIGKKFFTEIDNYLKNWKDIKCSNIHELSDMLLGE